jgi:hypothetical protein
LVTFILRAVPEARGMIRVRLGKNKDETIKDFLRAVSANPKGRFILLVDSDEPDHGGLFKNLSRTPCGGSIHLGESDLKAFTGWCK